MPNRKAVSNRDHCCANAQPPLDALAQADAVCAARGLNFTPQRRAVLALLAASPHPLGAYDLIERMDEGTGRRPAPVTVYRALDFLLEHGFAHRIESRNAFIACSQHHRGKDLMLFMICETCGCVSEVAGALLAAPIDAVAAQQGFRPSGRVIEIFGRCAHCQ